MRKTPTPPEPERLFRHGDRAAARPGVRLDFSVTVNPYGPPPSVVKALRAGLSAVGAYPDPDCTALAEKIAARHKVGRDCVAVGNGSNDLIYAAARALRPRRAGIVEPTYTEYLRASLLAGAEIEHWLPGADDLVPAPFEPGGADVVWVCNPNNPTGRLWPPGVLPGWFAAHPETVFVLDEAFLPLLPDGEDQTLAPTAARAENMIVLRSLTKAYALPGLRLGYAVSNPRLAARLRAQVVPWSVNALAQAAGLAALDDDDFLCKSLTKLWREVEPFRAGLRFCSERLEPLPTRATFFLVRLHGLTSGRLAGRLAGRGIAVRDAANFVGLDARHVRLSVRSRSDNGALLDALQSVLKEA